MSEWPHETPPGRCVHWPKTCAEVQAQTPTCFTPCAFCSPSLERPEGVPEEAVEAARRARQVHGSTEDNTLIVVQAAAPAIRKQYQDRIDELELRLEAAEKDPTTLERATEFAAGLEKGAKQERQRVEPVIAAARRVLKMHYGDQSPSNPAAHALFSALAALDSLEDE